VISLFFILFAFFCGALPFSVWLGKIFIGVDIRQFGDGNPGATNVFRAGNNYVGLLALMLDISKAAVPVGLAYNNLNLRGPSMFLIAIAPILGHMYSPFLGFKGGKAIATALGVWIGLTIWIASIPGALAAGIGGLLVTPSVWSVMFGLGAVLVTLLIWLPDPLLLWVWLAEVVIIAWTHRADLRKTPKLRPWLLKLLRIGGNQSSDG
jgi:glycerol-3-phosphate acyltransferase PlsY